MSRNADASTGVEAELARTARDLRIGIGRVASRLRKLFADAEGDATFTELAVLRRLDRDGPMAPGALAGMERVTAQWIGIVLTALAERRLITRSPDPSDGRKVIVSISAAGRRTLDSREQVVAERLVQVLRDDFDKVERAQLIAVLPLLDRLADKL